MAGRLAAARLARSEQRQPCAPCQWSTSSSACGYFDLAAACPDSIVCKCARCFAALGPAPAMPGEPRSLYGSASCSMDAQPTGAIIGPCYSGGRRDHGCSTSTGGEPFQVRKPRGFVTSLRKGREDRPDEVLRRAVMESILRPPPKLASYVVRGSNPTTQVVRLSPSVHGGPVVSGLGE